MWPKSNRNNPVGRKATLYSACDTALLTSYPVNDQAMHSKVLHYIERCLHDQSTS
jgi:hypothetical protein